ncbi:Mu-like prophage major head subunit gpT family protein [Roseococcus sp. SDR]|uniref:prohead protease/major capsid protein fusion protein n=1 Tax=Roseococcus sp. SDR TaxID=2835532 RepID=UPI001BCD1BB0|nr:prohead protease/major capsid protein fusion protein [Roseococcus sp. SDR]MBS7789268.1 hypothetical protein [Roseococcus sp. SDR]MBV1844582.1 Mu-like prophage major head subunit gpT family protein [Roseococcus sp. SDR]
MADRMTTPREGRAGEPLRREASFRPGTYDAEARTVEVTWTTGADVRRYDWWEGRHYIERLTVSEEAVDLSRLNAGAPVLDTHSSWELSDQIGVVERAWIEGGEGRAVLRFSEREDVQGIVRDIQAGIIRNISAGYWVDEWVVTPGTSQQVEIRTAARWTPGEISFVPVPADPGAGTRARPSTPAPRAVSTTTPPEAPAQQEARMAVPNSTTGQPPAETNDAAALDAARAAAATEAREAETARIRSINTAARHLGLESEAAALIESGATLEAAQQRLIEIMAERRAAGGTVNSAAITITRDEGDTKRSALQIAIEHRAGVTRELPAEAREFRGMSLIDLARESIHLAGGQTRGLTKVEVAKLAMNHRGMLMRSGVGLHTTSDFPNLLANTASKALGDGYGSARRSFTAWARQRTLPDFKSFRVINLSGAPALQQIAAVGQEAGEITFGTVGESAEAYQLFRAGRRVSISFEAIVNDDLSGFSRVPQLFGTAAARMESETVYGILNSNPNMSDSVALFAAGHANIFGNGVAGFGAGDGVISVQGLGVGRRVMRTQTAPNGDIIDLTPQFLLVPATLEMLALQFTSAQFVASSPGNTNPNPNTSLTPIVEPRLSSATQWYLVANNAEVDTVEYAYLEGMETPEVTTYVDEDTDGTIVKCTHNFGAKATDWRGMARASGT